MFRPGESAITGELLLSVVRRNPLGATPTPPRRPATALPRSELFRKSERHSVLKELASEIDSSDRIDLLCAFIKSGRAS